METEKTKIVYLFLVLMMAPLSIAQAQQVMVEPELKLLLNDAVQNSKTVQIEQQNAQQAANNRAKALKTYMPTVGVTTSYTHLNDAITFPSNLETLLMGTQQLLIKEQLGLGFNTPFPPGIPLQEVEPLQVQNIFRATLEADMVLFTGLQAPRLAKAAEHQQRAYEAMGDKEATSVIQQTIQMYKSLALMNKSEQVLENSERRLAEQSRFVAKAVEKGLATELEESRIELARQQLQQKWIDLNTQRQLALAMLSQLTGKPVDSLQALNPQLKEWMVDYSSQSIANRPELRALTEAELATEFKQKSTYGAYMPKVKLFGRKELYEDDLSLLDPEWMVGVGMSWNLFDGLKRSEDVQNAKLDVSKITLQKEQAQELLQVGIQKAELEYEAANQQITVAKQRVETAKKAYRILEKQYQVGLAPQRDFLDSENELQLAELGMTKAVYDQNMAAVNYLIAGGSLQHLIGQQ